MPTALSHPCQPHTRPAHCHLIFALRLGLAWLLVDSTLGWLPFSPGHSSVCVSRWTGQMLCWVGAPITLLLGVQSAPLSTPLTLACYLGKAGSGVREGGEGGARKRLLPEREETWELGNGKGQGPPPTHGFLSPPPPSANTWHGHKQGLCSLPLGQDWVKEAKNRQQGVR